MPYPSVELPLLLMDLAKPMSTHMGEHAYVSIDSLAVVISFTLLTLLTVSLLGVLTLTLVQRYLLSQQTAHLRSNADSVALQAEALMQPTVQTAPLLELARTVSFLDGVQVRILDPAQQPLVDSGLPFGPGQSVWFYQSSGPSMLVLEDPQAEVGAMESRSAIENRLGIGPAFDEWQPGSLVRIERVPGSWGNRLSFEVASGR